MSKMAFSYKREVKEPWQIEFESELIDDDKWSCIVTAAIESKPGDEECLRMFSQSAVSDINSPIYIINMSELIRMFKQDKSFGEAEKKYEKKGEKLSNGKTKKSNTGELAFPLPRFREVLLLISKYAIYSDGQCILPPELMAYALKYIILYKKDMDCFLRRRKNFERCKKREAEIRDEIINKLGLTITRKLPEEQSERENKEVNATKSTDFVWTRNIFDLSGSSRNDRPFNGPEIYIILSEFYDPLYFIELLKINVPLTAVIKIEDNHSSAGITVINKKLELINSFWTELERMVSKKETTEAWKDVAMLKFSVPQKDSYISAERRDAAVLEDLMAMVFTAFHLKRLHERYIQQMKVHRMIESLEPLDLSKCLVYTNLCDILIEDNFNVELFVLFGIIEQVVSGVPETRVKAHEYVSESVSSDDPAVKSWVDPECNWTPKNDSYEEEKYTIAPEFKDFYFSTEFLANILKDKDEKLIESDRWKSPLICFYGDSVSPRMFSIDHRIMKPKEIFERFLINSMGHKIWERFPKMSLAEEAWCEYQFFQLWKTSKDTEESLRVKLFFAIAMKLMGNSKFFVDECLSHESSLRSIRCGNNYEEPDPERKALTLPRLQFFGDVVNLIYHHNSAENLTENCEENQTLKKTEANSSLVSPLSSESDSSPKVCLTYRKADDSHVFGDGEDDTKTLPKLEKVLDFQDISFLNEPSLFSDHAVFKTFVNKYHFFEELEANRMVQQLEQCYENYNSLQLTYFSPTDTLFVVASNEVDPHGLSESNRRGFLTNPLSFRDFCQYVLFENGKWRANENTEYIKFLEEVKQKGRCEIEKAFHEYKCCLLKKLYSVSEPERINILKMIEETESTSKTNNFEEKKNVSTIDENKKEKLADVKKEAILSKDADDILPSKAQQSTQSGTAFHGINLGNLRIQVDERIRQFHSRDGTFVNVKSETWLYGETLVSMTIEKCDAKFTVHVSKENEKQRFFHFKNKSGNWITFSESKQFGSNMENQAFLLAITCLSGLMVEPLFLSNTTIIYVKQSYHQPYRREKDIKNEKFRCYLSNGQIVIFRLNGNVDILCPDGTKYACHKFTETEYEKGVSKRTCGEGESKEKDETSEKFEPEAYDVLMPNGEFWIKDQKSKRKYLSKTVTVLAGRNPETKELFLKREDGTSCMLWQDGKLVTTYPDGSKITSIPKFENELIVDGESGQTKDATLSHQSAESRNCIFGKPKISFSTEGEPVEDDEAFTSVTCSYLLEHPKYATVHYVNSAPEITVPEHMEIKVFSFGNYRVKTPHSILQIFGDTAKFHSSCVQCGKKSISKIFLTPLVSCDLLSETRDLFDNKLFVYDKGQLSFEAAKNSEGEYTESPETVSPTESAESCSIVNTRRRNMLPELCHHTAQKFFEGRCFAVQRDLSGLEFIQHENLAQYIYSLSESAYYDLGQIVHKTIFKQHNFFDPLYKRGKERWMMDYKEKNSYPITMKRKDIVPLIENGSSQTEMRPIFPGLRSDDEKVNAQRRYQMPHVVIARFIRVLHTDPYEVIKEINILVSLHQKIALDILNSYKSHSSKSKQYLINKYVAKELELIASTFFKSMDLYSHTSITVPYTDLDIHSAAHKLQLNEHIEQENVDNLLKCKQIYNLLRHKGKSPNIPETEEKEETQYSIETRFPMLKRNE